jgi:hypothetical protein
MKKIQLNRLQISFFATLIWTLILVLLLIFFNQSLGYQLSVFLVFGHLVVLVILAYLNDQSDKSITVFYVVDLVTTKEVLTKGSPLSKIPTLNSDFEGFRLEGRPVTTMSKEKPTSSCVYVASRKSSPSETKPTPNPVAKPVSHPTPVVAQSKTSSDEPIKELKLSELKLANFNARKKFYSQNEVESGTYIEVTPNLYYVNRMVISSGNPLPNVINPANHYIKLESTEKSMIIILGTDAKDYLKKTPGSIVSPGYYFEVDTQDHALENVIFTENRLPPSAAKGHRWVKIQPRKIV